MKSKHLLASLIGSLLAISAVSAHHSFAMFDNTREVTIEGTIKEFQWTNPHTFIHVWVKDPATGKDVDWAVEGSPTTSLKRRGWSSKSLLPGDKVKVVLYPLRGGGPGGGLVSVSKDGQPVGGPPPS